MILKQVIRYTNAPALEATWVRYDQLPDVEVPASPALYDKDGNEVQAAAEAHTKPGEILETVLKCHAYSNHPEQIEQLRTDLGDDLPKYEELINEVASTYTPPPPPTDEEHNETIYFQIDQLERQYMLPRITREATILQLETWALSKGYPLDQFRIANKGYRGLKELDEQMQQLRGQLK